MMSKYAKITTKELEKVLAENNRLKEAQKLEVDIVFPEGYSVIKVDDGSGQYASSVRAHIVSRAADKPAKPQFKKGEWVCSPAVGEHFPDFIGIYAETIGDCATIDVMTGQYRGRNFCCSSDNLRHATNEEVGKALDLKPGDVVKLWCENESGAKVGVEYAINCCDAESAQMGGPTIGLGYTFSVKYSNLHPVSWPADKPVEPQFEPGEWVRDNNQHVLTDYIGIYVETSDFAAVDRVTGKYRGNRFYFSPDNLRRATSKEVSKALNLKKGDVVKMWSSDKYAGQECVVMDYGIGVVTVKMDDGITQRVLAYDLHLVSRAADKPAKPAEPEEPAVRLYRLGDVIQTPQGRELVEFDEIANQRFVNGWSTAQIALLLAADEPETRKS